MAGKKPPKLTARQERFVAEYLIDLKASEAAIRAGYSAKTAETCGPRLLRFVQVATAIAKAKEQRLTRVHFTQDRVLEELAILAFSDHTHFQVDDKGTVTLSPDAPKGAHRAVSSIKRKVISLGDSGLTQAEVEIRLWDKPGPLKLAGRHVGLFPDKMELTGKDGAPLAAPVVMVVPNDGSGDPGAD